MHMTYNMPECCKYEMDGTHKKRFGKGQCNSTAPDKKTASAYAQLSTKIAKLKKVSKKLKKSTNKCKHRYDSDSNDSDSS